jgi:hypothetical protein
MNEYDVLQQRMNQWSEAFTAILQSQATLMEVLEEQLAVEFQTLMGVVITPGQLAVLRDAVLNRADEAWRAEVSVAQHEEAEIVIESVYSRLVYAYEDYLRRHWQTRPKALIDVSVYDTRIAQLLEAHLQRVRELLSANPEAEVLRQGVIDLQVKWREQPPLEALATREELALLKP